MATSLAKRAPSPRGPQDVSLVRESPSPLDAGELSEAVSTYSLRKPDLFPDLDAIGKLGGNLSSRTR